MSGLLRRAKEMNRPSFHVAPGDHAWALLHGAWPVRRLSSEQRARIQQLQARLARQAEELGDGQTGGER
jgi:hypothetical protein